MGRADGRGYGASTLYVPPVSSSRRRFFTTLGYSLMQAVLFGALVGSLVYFRVSRTDDDDPELQPWHTRLRHRLEDWERQTFDWRARELGAVSKRSDATVMVSIDDEAIANGRRDEHPGLNVQPWPREIVGGIIDRLITEGASLVVVDLPLSDASPSTCPTPGISGGATPSDDDALRSLIERNPGRVILGFDGSTAKGPAVGAQPKPFLVMVDEKAPPAQAREEVRRILSERRPAFVVSEGARSQVLAGVSSDEEARVLAKRLESRAGETRDFEPNDLRYQVTAVDLLVSLSEVTVDGLDVSALPRIRSVEHPLPLFLGERERFGDRSVSPDEDGVVRGVPQLVSYVDAEGRAHVLPSLALAAAMQLQGTRRLTYAHGRLEVGDKLSVPMDPSGYSLIQWDAADAARDARGSLKRRISAWRIVLNLFDRLQGAPPHFRNELEGRVVVLTNTARGTSLVETPIGAASGAAVVGQALDNLLESRGVTRADPRIDLIVTAALAFVGAFLALTFGGGLRTAGGFLLHFASAGIAAGVFLWIARNVFLERRMWIAVAGPLIAMGCTFTFTTLYNYRVERRLRDFIRAALGTVSGSVSRRVLGDLTLMRPDRRLMTVLFSDIEGFTRLSESLQPEQLVTLLNDYLTEMTGVIRRNEGQIDKYIGDSITAFWGAPLRSDRHAHQACHAALAMRDALVSRQKDWEQRYGQHIEFRAGINTGDVVVGDMGTEQKSNYTVLGDAVSFAWRLERENRYYGTYVLCGEQTARIAGDRFLFREVDRVRMKGRPLPVQIFELLGLRQGTEKPERIKVFEQALLAYHQRRFLEAAELFNRCHTELGDALSAVYVRRCDHYLDAPPPEAWDGVFELGD